MAGKISELTELGNPVGAVEVEVLNNGVNYRARPAGKFIIEEIELATAGEFDFDSLPQGYKRLVIEGHVRAASGTGLKYLNAYINADETDSNYHSQALRAGNGASSFEESATPNIAVLAPSDAAAEEFTAVQLVFEGYAGTIKKTARSNFVSPRGAGFHYVGALGVLSAITDPVTRIRIRTDNHPTDGLIGKLTLYGEL